MQPRTLILFLTAGALITFGGCDRHDWESTRVLHQGHGGGGHGDHGEGGHDGDHQGGEKGHEKPHHEEDAHQEKGDVPPKEAEEAESKGTESHDGGEAKTKGKPRVL